jgi:hypothetical protein
MRDVVETAGMDAGISESAECPAPPRAAAALPLLHACMHGPGRGTHREVRVVDFMHACIRSRMLSAARAEAAHAMHGAAAL